MATWLIVVLVVLAVVVLLALGGALANARRRRELRPRFEAEVEEANRALAAAHAEDKGWDPDAVHAAARDAFARERPDERIRELTLVQVVDPPGVAEDKAVFQVVTETGRAQVTLGRRADGGWETEGIEGR